MAGYISPVVKLTRSFKSDIMKDKPKYLVVDVVPVGVPSPHSEKFAPYADKATTIEHSTDKFSESLQIKVDYDRDGFTSLGLEGWGEDADSARTA